MIRRYAVALAASAALVLSGCSDWVFNGGPLDDPSAEPESRESITILAAASLTTVLPEIEEAWAAEGIDYDLDISFAGSSTIVQQVNEGAPADVILLAGESSLSTLITPDGAPATSPVIFATNSLTLAVPANNPANITSLADLDLAITPNDSPTLVVCAQQVPCGEASEQMFAQAGFSPDIASFEPDVRATLAKASSGEADAAVVYRTDIAAATSDVTAIDIPDDINVTNRYPALAISDNPQAPALIDDLLGDTAQQVLTEAGFGAP
ncbi:molybdate ABC transporter substrate-binding protein [Ornithinimicrobium sp. INDO-MA30-4]|uniref:molybdate ABC transporter substrate-binding protein n=1 Tax=Ornithinimicrobium sp. INDO-MA30-4 TaxID=2908651 RepID=UPI001F1B9ECD|nr:molybdate ABC transporter substrate-binding protein [Ornithinimicrobium sp. INDO-MA30-4]UJH69572.1 molybdate ABC transporter substrate-binding protein [Ornithinimicrobium sp. INDO-MA30-4]